MFSKACKYAMRAALFLAQHSDEEHKVGVKEIAESIAVPKHFLAKILQTLSRQNLISSVQGSKGGFYSSAENKKITLEDIIKCIDGAEVFDNCILGTSECSPAKPCPLHFQAIAYREGLRFQLRALSVEELSKKISESLK